MFLRLWRTLRASVRVVVAVMGALVRFVRRWRAPLVLIPLTAGLVAAGGVGATLLWADVPARVPMRLVVCWDGVRAPASDCSVPTGTEGLEWVFPNFDPADGGCSRVDRAAQSSGRPTEWQCLRTVRGRLVTVSYRQRSDLDRGLRFLRATYADADQSLIDRDRRIIWRTGGRTAEATLLTAYRDYPFTLTIVAPGNRIREAAFRKERFRAATYVTHRPPRRPPPTARRDGTRSG